MSASSVCVRFAPSPTGYLHVGGARTALFNFLFARHQQGRFLLRIEDTDTARSESRLTDSILESLGWMGLSWDEPPVFQSERSGRHLEICRSLRESGHAYPCFCAPEKLADEREKAREAGEDSRYDRSCLQLSDSERDRRIRTEPYSLRFHVPEGETCFNDLVHGQVCFPNKDIEDFVILRSDQSPVYQIAVVADDHDMGITHVIRGDDHLSNTPKQILLYRAMGWKPPGFGHVPLILGSDKKRLSKRHGATSVETYRDQGILPETLVNFLALLGWNPGDDREIMDQETLVREFSLERISKKAAVFDLKKLEWMNASYISNSSPERLLEAIGPGLEKAGWIGNTASDEEKTYIIRIIELLKPRMKTLCDFTPQAELFFSDPSAYEEAAVRKCWMKPGLPDQFRSIMDSLESLENWDAASIEQGIRRKAEDLSLKAGDLIHPVRLALTGSGSSPGLFEVMEILGRERVQRRLGKALESISRISISP